MATTVLCLKKQHINTYTRKYMLYSHVCVCVVRRYTRRSRCTRKQSKESGVQTHAHAHGNTLETMAEFLLYVAAPPPSWLRVTKGVRASERGRQPAETISCRAMCSRKNQGGSCCIICRLREQELVAKLVSGGKRRKSGRSAKIKKKLKFKWNTHVLWGYYYYFFCLKSAAPAF